MSDKIVRTVNIVLGDTKMTIDVTQRMLDEVAKRYLLDHVSDEHIRDFFTAAVKSSYDKLNAEQNTYQE